VVSFHAYLIIINYWNYINVKGQCYVKTCVKCCVQTTRNNTFFFSICIGAENWNFLDGLCLFPEWTYCTFIHGVLIPGDKLVQFSLMISVHFMSCYISVSVSICVGGIYLEALHKDAQGIPITAQSILPQLHSFMAEHVRSYIYCRVF